MPLFYFDSDDGEVTHADTLGASHADDECARVASLRLLLNMAREYLPAGGPARTMTMGVRTGGGDILLRLALTLTAQSLPAQTANQN